MPRHGSAPVSDGDDLDKTNSYEESDFDDCPVEAQVGQRTIDNDVAEDNNNNSHDHNDDDNKDGNDKNSN